MLITEENTEGITFQLTHMKKQKSIKTFRIRRPAKSCCLLASNIHKTINLRRGKPEYLDRFCEEPGTIELAS